MANLLRVDIYELTDALTQKSMILRGEEILSPLSVEQVPLLIFHCIECKVCDREILATCNIINHVISLI